MPLMPVRNLAAKGILKDPHPYDLPSNAFTGGTNVRFEVGKARRAPVHRVLRSSLTADPRHVVGYRPSTGFDQLYVGGVDGSVYRFSGGTYSDFTPSGRALAAYTAPWTDAFLGDCLYLNRPADVPVVLTPNATAFAPMASWDSTWRTRSLRSYRDFLVAVNVTKGVAEHGTMVKWSDATLAGQAPGSWDATSITTLAGENVLAQLDSPLVDSCPLKQSLILYSTTQVWSMEFTGNTADAGQNMFIFTPLFTDMGAISQNCAVEVQGKHYVFGTTDLYVHDGTNRQSISEGRVREWVFKHLNAQRADRCFVMHMPKYNEVLFAFVSGDSEAFFPNPTHCNRGAVYNYSSDTWSLVDLPNVSSAGLANIDPVMLWSSPKALNSWGHVGGTWYDLLDGYEQNVVFGAATIAGGPTSHKLLAYDHMDRGSLAYPYDPESNAPAFVERIGIDLDETGADLTTSKIVKRILPQVSIYREVALQIKVGSSMSPGGPITWGPIVSFNPATQYKVDVMRGGRYLAIRFTVGQPADFEISGFDADIISGGRR